MVTGLHIGNNGIDAEENTSAPSAPSAAASISSAASVLGLVILEYT